MFKIIILEMSRPHETVIQKPVDKFYRPHLKTMEIRGRC